MSSALGERAGSQPAPRPHLTLVPKPRTRPGAKTALAGIYLVAFAYHWLQSRAHVTPAVFGDELLYSKLAQSVAAGDGFAVRGEPVFFPAPLAVLAQVPAWLLQSTPTAYAVVKLLNAAIMASAAFPAYCLARRVARPSFALIAAAAAVAGPAMLYGAYLMSEALAYPVFLLALATMLRAIERPSRRMELAVVAVSIAAVLTRLQFIVLPVAYLLAVPAGGALCGERLRLVGRRHVLSLGVLAAMCAVPVVAGGALLGTYRGAALLDFEVGAVLSWTGLTAALLPFAAGWLVVPGALVGLAALGLRPRGRADAAFAVLASAVTLLVLLEAGLIAAGEADRTLERYAIYVVPLAAIAFFAYVERGAPWRRIYAAVALVCAGTAWLLPFPTLVLTSFTFDAPTFSVYGQLAEWWDHGNAAAIFAGIPLVAGVALACLPLTRRHAPHAIGLATIALLLLSGIPAYAADHEMTRGTLALRAGDPPDWLERSGLGPADYLQLPGSSAHYGWLLETWNQDVGRTIRLDVPGDGFASSSASIDRSGRLLVDGRPAFATDCCKGSRVLVVGNFWTQIELEGTVLARPRPGLTAYRVPAALHIRSLAEGLTYDRWATASVRYRVWPSKPTSVGIYRAVLELPSGHEARTVALTVEGGATRTVRLSPGARRTVEVPARGHPVPALRIRTDRADPLAAETADARLVAVRISTIGYEPRL